VKSSTDRRVQIIDGSDELPRGVRLISDLRSARYVVLLGEPGIGKSTVFKEEAAFERASCLPVREFIAEEPVDPGATLFLDGLDEFRTEGQPSDKAYSLGRAIKLAGVSRWRLACRSEDWRNEADVKAIRRAAVEGPILVAQLLPLDRVEAAAVLVALGENEPEEFLSRAERLGAGGFVENPLSLKLLCAAVSPSREWPKTRFDLFRSATVSLSHEKNEDLKRTERRSPTNILSMASKACLLMLVSGSQAIWRSHDEPPFSGDPRAFLASHILSDDASLLRDTLDTALFRGEGDRFEPMHRTVAEFLAGQALAEAVVRTTNSARVPLSRALAMITEDDGAPPTELRGLYAWFAAHLARLGDEAGACRLVEANAFTVLAYGDAAVFSTALRRKLLFNLDRSDPYFRASEIGVTAIGGLSGEDLVADFTAVLTGPADGTHRMLTVLDVLTHGAPVASLRPLLRKLALDRTQLEGIRWRSADAWLNGEPDVAKARRELFDAVADEPVSASREGLRSHLATKLPVMALSVADIKSMLVDFERLPDDAKTMRLYTLRRRLEAEPRPELFDEPTTAWRLEHSHGQRSMEVDDILDKAMSAVIRQAPDMEASALWRLIVNKDGDVWASHGGEVNVALSDWLRKEPGRDVSLFEAMLAEDKPAFAPGAIATLYTSISGRNPSAATVGRLFERALGCAAQTEARRLLEIAVAIVRRLMNELDLYWAAYDCLAADPDHDDLLVRLTTSDYDSMRKSEAKRTAEIRRAFEIKRARNSEMFAPRIEALRLAQDLDGLNQFAERYFRILGPSKTPQMRLDLVVDETNEAIAAAIVDGWKRVATEGMELVDASEMGRDSVQGLRRFYEFAAIAGLDRLLAEDNLPSPKALPWEVAFAVLKSSYMVADEGRRRLLEDLAINQLNVDPGLGGARLFEFLSAAIDAGATQIDCVWRLSESTGNAALSAALDKLLSTRRTMPPDALRSALIAAAKHVDRDRLKGLVAAAMDDPAVTGDARRTWSLAAFALDPDDQAQRFVSEHAQDDVQKLFDRNTGYALVEACASLAADDGACRNAVIIHLLGPTTTPERVTSSRVMRASGADLTVTHAIGALSDDTHPTAAKALAALIEEPALADWRPNLRHALAQQMRRRRDHARRHPDPEAIKAALSGGPPVNACDLRAIAKEELLRLRGELRTGENSPWKRYWNVDSRGNVTTPRVENECRDHLLDRLNDRLRPYMIAAALPESRRANETRVDVLILTFAGRNLPIEVKRHFHPDIWGAASTQLQGYAEDEGADGFGIYLVFWFGNAASPTPARRDGGEGPTSAAELEGMLIDDLQGELRSRTDVTVFDVSDAKSKQGTKPRRKRGKTQ
jgi:hypothetical protein